jgi:hypothetical protein
MPEHKFVYQDEHGIRRTLVYDDDKPKQFAVVAEADMTNLAEVNRAQGAHESARHGMTTLARVPFTVWERAHHEDWDDKDWNRFLNDPDNRDYRVWRGWL